MRRILKRRLGVTLIGALVLALTANLVACAGGVQWLGVRLLYEETSIPAERVVRDVPYRDGSDDPEASSRPLPAGRATAGRS